MPVFLTLGHVLLAVAFVDALAAVMLGVSASRHQGYSPGTPQYARERTHKRTAFLLAGSAVLFAMLAFATWNVALAEAR